jgi:hypothetical protein
MPLASSVLIVSRLFAWAERMAPGKWADDSLSVRDVGCRRVPDAPLGVLAGAGSAASDMLIAAIFSLFLRPGMVFYT